MTIVLDESNQEFDDRLQLQKNSGSRGLHINPIDTDLDDCLENTLWGSSRLGGIMDDVLSYEVNQTILAKLDCEITLGGLFPKLLFHQTGYFAVRSRNAHLVLVHEYS
jgi:hypothetical protein